MRPGEELVFHNGTVFDGRQFRPAGTTVRISGGKITAVGPPGPPHRATAVDLAGGGAGCPQVAAAQLVTGEHRVRVGVYEPGQKRAAGQVNGGRPVGRPGWPDRGDLPAAYPDAGASGEELPAVEDGAVVEDQFLAGPHGHLPPC